MPQERVRDDRRTQNALMLAASTYDPWWPRIAEDFVTRLETSMQELDVVAAVTGNPTTTDGARTALVRWLVASEEILRGSETPQSVATLEYPGRERH